MRRLLDAFVAFWSTLFQPSSERKGQKFEELVQDAVFTEEHYDLIHLTQDGTTNYIRYVKSSEYPDFKFKDKSNGKKFWVEAKYRTKWYGTFPDQYIGFMKEYQLARYKEVDKTDPVFIAIGTGNKAWEPNQVYLIPVSRIEMAERIYKKFLLPFEIDNAFRESDKDKENFVLPSKELWERIEPKYGCGPDKDMIPPSPPKD